VYKYVSSVACFLCGEEEGVRFTQAERTKDGQRTGMTEGQRGVIQKWIQKKKKKKRKKKKGKTRPGLWWESMESGVKKRNDKQRRSEKQGNLLQRSPGVRRRRLVGYSLSLKVKVKVKVEVEVQVKAKVKAKVKAVPG
jgi:hypothetical protein